MRNVVFEEGAFRVDRSNGGPTVLLVDGKPVIAFDAG